MLGEDSEHEESGLYATDETSTNGEEEEADEDYEENGNTEGEVEICSTIDMYVLINVFRILNTKNTFVILGKWGPVK
ncbi:hypothetical protein T265_12401 [Opisthorchis viverrini]|uniref:Uncharacterized protein n=1 Tax=Opisthorchis viverrini TaxID=6198 RepID=A0A074ZRR5_OPIVI|nr:hypothetical protein T265_12401 [Opisthorchis viverrini]KER18009.1 hypothetical protein T265_12401 [Opisthorchis viverrini]